MKVIIAGSRTITDYEEFKSIMEMLALNITEVISGAHWEGGDVLGERWAGEKGIPVRRFPADWRTYGLKAGPMRNRKMAYAADALVAFWDGESKGTKNMVAQMTAHNKPYVLVDMREDGDITFFQMAKLYELSRGVKSDNKNGEGA